MKYTLSLLTLLLSLPISAQQSIQVQPRTVDADGLDRKLNAELIAMRDEDQAIIKQSIKSNEGSELAKKAQMVNSRHIKRIKEILTKTGWPPKSRIGQNGSTAIWLILQHSQPEILKSFFPSMETAASKGDLDWSLVATSKDRVLIQEGKKQIYGTQFKITNKKVVPLPIEDEPNVDKRRAAIGLTPIHEYLQQAQDAYFPKE